MKCSDFMMGLVLLTAGLLACERSTNSDAGRTTSFSGDAAQEPSAAPARATPLAIVSNQPNAGDAKSPTASSLPVASPLRVKRLLVTIGVKDREPLASDAALPSDGTPIYAFAELSNPDGESENVRITFERQGGAERVGNVTLPVPGKVARHRTWASTRFIRTAGVWEAVLWSESGSELGRTSFEVTGASS